MSEVLDKFYRTLDNQFKVVNEIGRNLKDIQENKYLTEQMKFANIKNDIQTAINHLENLPSFVDQNYNDYVDEQTRGQHGRK